MGRYSGTDCPTLSGCHGTLLEPGRVGKAGSFGLYSSPSWGYVLVSPSFRPVSCSFSCKNAPCYDHLAYIYSAVSELFSNAPRSLRILHYTNQSENPWKDSLPALNVLSTEVDTLAINLQGLSISLRELKLEYTSLTLDFLWPLDNVGHPLSSTASLNWPNLTRMEFNYVPPWLP